MKYIPAVIMLTCLVLKQKFSFFKTALDRITRKLLVLTVLPEAAVKVASFFSVLNKNQVDLPVEA